MRRLSGVWAIGAAAVLAAGAWAAEPPAPGTANMGPRSASSTARKPARATEAPPADTSLLDQYAATNRFRLGAPTGYRVAPGDNAVLFLRSGPRSFVQDLWSFEPATGRERPVLTAQQILRGAEESLSPEERARRERMRVTARGIASFQMTKDGRRLLVPLDGRLFVVEREGNKVRELPRSPGAPVDARFSPDGSRVACVRDGDLWVTDLANEHSWRLTDGANDTLTHGLAEFVAQEEMRRREGWWWSPDGQTIAYAEVATGSVEALDIADPTHPERGASIQRYPRPGRANATVRLGLVPAQGGHTTWVSWDDVRYPYLCTVRWSDYAPLTLVVMNREQTEAAILAADPASGGTRTLWTEKDKAWLNLYQSCPRWLDDGSGFLWISERSGVPQLELHAPDGRLLRALHGPELNLRDLLAVDTEAGTVWVSGGPDPTQKHLYWLPLSGQGEAIRATSAPGVHDAAFGPGYAVYVHTFDGADGEKRVTVHRRGGELLGDIRSMVETPRRMPRVEWVTVGDSVQYRASIVRPTAFIAGRRYPVLVSVYGGPHAQEVTQQPWRYLLAQWYADRGYVVVSIDNRGTPARGRAWERAIQGNLVDLALADQVSALQLLGARYPELDLGRVGVYGWSFGGYMAAMMVMKRPDVYHAAVAGAPVADWLDYDTFYTERYLGLPQSNPRGYEASSVLTWAPKLQRPLLLVHGTTDDNVHVAHSLKLADALFRAGRPFEFLPLAGFTHLVPDPNVTVRLNTRMAEFFDRALGVSRPAGAATMP